MHDGTIAQADAWLSQIVPIITHSQVFQQDGALFITWDEGSTVNNDNNPIGMIMLSPFIKPGFTSNIAYSHFSYLKTIQEIFNVSPLLGGAAVGHGQDSALVELAAAEEPASRRQPSKAAAGGAAAGGTEQGRPAANARARAAS